MNDQIIIASTLVSLCRAMLCITRLAVTRCLSARLSVCHVRELRQKNKDIFEIFSPSGSQAILVFPCQTGWR